ncbi:MAG: hypothetical protein PUF20_10705 [Clostridiales bacterium]|nr:hypothetical protein [Clostridiales bacterium]
MADYYINSDYGKQLAGSLKAGDMAEASDGSTWRKEADGSVTVWKNGQTMTGRVGVSAPAVSEAPSSSASPTVETPTLDAATGSSSQQTTAVDYTGSAQEQRDQEQAQARLASEKAKAATEKVTAGLDQSSSDELLNQAIQQASTPEYKISSAQGVLLADGLRMAGDMAEASDGSTWRREADGSISVRKGDRTYKANIDRAAAKQDPQWAILTAPAPAAAETGSGKKSSGKSSSGSASSRGSGTYTFPAASTGTQKTPTATATGTDRASLRKQAATAQKEMGDLARQISVAKIRGKDTSALQAKYNEAKARYDAANTQIQAPQQLSTSGARQEQFSQRQTLMEMATQQAAERKDAWQSLPTVRDSERFSDIDNVTTGRMRGAEQQQIAGAVKELQKNAWRSLPTVQDSGRFSIPSQTDSLMQQAIAKTPRTLSGKPYLPENNGGFSHSSGTSKSMVDRLAAQQMNIAMANDDYDTIRRIREQNNYLDDNESFKYLAGRAKTGLLGAIQGVGNALSYLFQAKEPEGYDWDNPVMTGDQFAESVSGLKQTFSFADTDAQKFAQRYAGRNIPAAQRTAGSVAEGVAGMIPTIASNIAVPGSSLYVLFTQAAGSATTDALQRGASGKQAVTYGVANGALEVLTEKMFDGVAGVFGKGAADDALQSLVRRVTQNKGAQNALLTIADSLGEGFEEFASEFGDKVLADLLLKDDDRNFRQVLSDAGESFLVGALTSAVMQAAGSITKNTTPKQAAEKVNNILQEDIRQEGINANVREAAKQSDLDRSTLETMRPEAFQTPTWAELMDTQQTMQGAAERGTEGVITVGQLNIDNTANRGYANNSEGGQAYGRTNQLDGASGEGVWGRSDGDGLGSSLAGRVQRNGRGNLSESGIVLLSPESQRILTERGIVNVELHDSSADNAAFSYALAAARTADQRNGWAVTPKSVQELKESGARSYMDTNGSTGFAIAPDGDIEAVFANKAAGAPKGSTKSTIPQAIALGGNKLDCYGHNLVDIYSKYGFEPVARVAFNPEYANDGWTADKGSPDIYFMMHNGDSADAVVQNMNKYKRWSKAELDALPLMDYDSAYQYRDFLLNKSIQRKTENDMGAMRSKFKYVPKQAQTQSNTINQNVSATDSTGAAPAGFDPLSHASNQYGAIPPGEKASRVVDIPASMDGETKVRRFTRTAAEAQVTTDEMVNRIENLVADGKLDYEVYGNKQALQDGKDLIEKQYTRGKTIEQIRSDFIRDANNGKGGAKFVSQGTMLYADAIAAGDYQTASDILVALAAVETNAGQTVQAARLLKSMSPEGRIFTVQKMVSNLEAQINQRRSGNKQIEINVPDALLNAYQNATTETAQQTALDNIYQNIADQVPTTLREGLQQWRYFSMLANPSTHAKNITGNVSGAVAKIGKDNIGALLETIFIGDKPGYRTKAFLNLASEADQNLLNKAWADYDTASELFEDSVGKYSQSSGEINDRRRYWKINDPQSAVTKGIDKALGAAEKVADFNTKALEVEDMWFSKPMYATALASYMKANHMTEITDAARTYAMSEAKRGTFNDLNAVSKWASQIGNDSKLGRFLAGTIYPFKKVPANVMVRTVEYSPLGFAKGVYDLVQMSKGNTDYTAAKAIDDFAAGATGSALLGIGIALAKQGILRATGIGDDKEKEQQKNAFGAKDFSLIAGDTYIPIDSFTLNGTALLTGAQIWEAVQNAKNGDEPVSLEDILDALSKITDPVFEQSMLTGLDSVISTIKNSGNDVGTGEMLAKLGIQIVGNYIGQYVPTILGRIASSTDKNQRSTYIEPDGPWDPVQSAIQGVQKKVPGWRQQMAVTYGNWGVPVEGNGAGSTASAIGKAVTPIYPSQKKTDPVEEEIARLHDANSAYANFYKRPSKTISVDGKSVKLTSDQYGNYVVARGQTDYNLRSAMLENDLYKSLPDQIKSKAMEMSQAYATEIGREAAGVGYQSQEKWVNDLAGKSQDDVLNAVLLRAVESSGYISPETQAQLTKVEQQFGGTDYVGLSDELFNAAKEKANTYFSAVEAAKYGGELTETQKELADKDSKELARYFMDKAIESRYTDTNKSGTKADEYLKAYRHGELNDAMALAVLSDKEVMAYDRFGRSAKVTPEMALQAANAHAGMNDVKDEDGKVTSSAQDQFDAWLDKQSWTDDQKSAVRMGFYSDSVKTYSYLADQLRKGNIRTADAKSELTTSYQAGWSKNVRDTGAKMADYIDAIVEYEDRPSEEERKAAGYKNTWTWFCDYLNTTDLTQEQKFGIAISMSDYSDKTKQKIWAALR